MNWPTDVLSLSAVVATHNGAHRTDIIRKPMHVDEAATVQAGGATWSVHLQPLDSQRGQWQVKAAITEGAATQCAWGLSIADSDWGTDNFVLLPGSVYAGNRFHAKRFPYSPPAVGPDPAGTDRTPWINDIPRLSLAEGPSHLDQMSIDGAIPGLGIYFPRRKKAMVLLTPQGNEQGPFGLEVIESADRTHAEILLTSPGLRKDKFYSISGYLQDSTDRAADYSAGDTAIMPLHVFWFDCESVQDLFAFIFAHRSDAFESQPMRKELPFSAAWDILEQKHNRDNWHEADSIYQVSILQDPPNPFMFFQTGWTGGMMTPYPLLQEGSPLSRERALRNMQLFFAGAQTPFGLFHEYYFEGKWISNSKSLVDSEGFSQYYFDPAKQWTLVRRIGDLLYFLIRELMLLRDQEPKQPLPEAWIHTMRRNLAAIEAVWRMNGEFGQYVDVYTGKVMVAGSTAGALIPAGLVLASQFFGEEKWLALAEEIAAKYLREDLAAGVTTGGPGDCLQAPESESIAALIDTFILLYEETGKPHWLKAAGDSVVQAASWVLSYDYAFPEGTALQQIGAQSRGAFIANAQNKTGVPGICTLSGQSILRVFRATGDVRYLDLLREISHSIPQYLGRKDKKIPTRLAWGRKGLTELPEGWICERVNVTQWGEAIGEISAYSCWCEIAMMLTWADIPGVYLQPDTGVLAVFDHIHAELIVEDQIITAVALTNPTPFPARVKLMVESSHEAKRPRQINFAAALPVIDIPAGSSRTQLLSPTPN